MSLLVLSDYLSKVPSMKDTTDRLTPSWIRRSRSPRDIAAKDVDLQPSTLSTLLSPRPTDSTNSNTESRRLSESSKYGRRRSIRGAVNRLRASSSTSASSLGGKAQERDVHDVHDWFAGFQRYNQLVTRQTFTELPHGLAKASKTFHAACSPIDRDDDGNDLKFLNHPDPALYKDVSLVGTVVDESQSARPSGATATGQWPNKICCPDLTFYDENTRGFARSGKPVTITDAGPAADVEITHDIHGNRSDPPEYFAWDYHVGDLQDVKDVPELRHEHDMNTSDTVAWYRKKDFVTRSSSACRTSGVYRLLPWLLAMTSPAAAYPVSYPHDDDTLSWRQRALANLTEIPVSLSQLPVPAIVTGTTGYGAYYCYTNQASGKAAIGMFGMGAIYLNTRAPPADTTAEQDTLLLLSIGIGYVSLMVTYCRLVVNQNNGGRVFYAGGLALALLFTLMLMAIQSVQAYWIQLTGLDPVFALGLSIPVAFAVCHVAIDVHRRLNGH